MWAGGAQTSDQHCTSPLIALPCVHAEGRHVTYEVYFRAPVSLHVHTSHLVAVEQAWSAACLAVPCSLV